jgi:hypothetical protein
LLIAFLNTAIPEPSREFYWDFQFNNAPRRRRRGIFLETPAKTKFKPVGAAYSGMSLLRSLIHLESQNYNDASLTGLPANPIASFQPGRRAIFPLRQPELGRGRKACWGRAPL